MSPQLTLTACALLTLFAPALAASPGDADWRVVQLGLWNPAQLVAEDESVYGLRLNLGYATNRAVKGFDLGIVNEYRLPSGGVQLGLLNRAARVSDGGFYRDIYTGLQTAIVSNHVSALNGLQIAGITNRARWTVQGVQLAFLLNTANRFLGAQIGAVNFSGFSHGLQLGMVGFAEEHTGVQAALFYNYAENIDGFQFSPLVNYANDARGLQFGNVNWAWSIHGAQIGIFNATLYESRGLQLGLANLAEEHRGLQMGFLNYATELSGLQIGLINIIKTGPIPVTILVNGDWRSEADPCRAERSC